MPTWQLWCEQLYSRTVCMNPWTKDCAPSSTRLAAMVFSGWVALQTMNGTSRIKSCVDHPFKWTIGYRPDALYLVAVSVWRQLNLRFQQPQDTKDVPDSLWGYHADFRLQVRFWKAQPNVGVFRQRVADFLDQRLYPGTVRTELTLWKVCKPMW